MLCRSCSSCAVVGDSRDPTVAARFFLGQGSECRKLRRSRSCSTSDKVVDDTVAAVHRRFSRPCYHAATVATVAVTQIQVIARVRGQSSCATENGTRFFAVAVLAALEGFFSAVDAIFRAPPVVPDLSISLRALEHSHL